VATPGNGRVGVSIFFSLAATVLIGVSPAIAGHDDGATKVKLVPVVDNTDLVTDINVVGDAFFVCTQPGLLLRSAGGRTTVVLDLTREVGRLGTGIPSLSGLGYPEAESYDERGLLGFAAHPDFQKNGTFWVWYTAIDERSAHPPGFFQWLTSTKDPWDQSQYDHVGHLVEYQAVGGGAVFRRTLLKIKRPYFNHTGYQSLVWSPQEGALLLGLGDGGSEYDPNNIAQDDEQLSGKLLKIDLEELGHRDFTHSAPVATFGDLRRLGVSVTRFDELGQDGHSDAAVTALIKGLRNPSKVSFESDGSRAIKYLANTGQDTIEWAHAFDRSGLNFGFRPWEGIFPTSFETAVPPPPESDNRAIAFGLEASRLYPSLYRPFVHYTHLDGKLGPNANTGSALYRGSGIPGLAGDLVFTDWISFNPDPANGGRRHGLLMHATPNRSRLQEPQTVKVFALDLSAVGFTSPTDVLFFTSINTDRAGHRLFVGGYKRLQFIKTQRDSRPHVFAGGVFEVVADR
jgi:Glucose / Sorbosone dehydrogenase